MPARPRENRMVKSFLLSLMDLELLIECCPFALYTQPYHLCSSAHNLFFCEHSYRQLEPPLPLNFSCRIFVILLSVSIQIDNWNHYLWNFPVGYSSFCSSSELFHESITWQGRFGLLGALPWVWRSDSSFRDLLPSRPSRRNLKIWFQASEFAVSCTVAK